MTRVTLSLLKSTPFLNQEMVGAGTPVAVHISAPEAPSEKVTVGFWEGKMAATGATGRDSANDSKWRMRDKSYARSPVHAATTYTFTLTHNEHFKIHTAISCCVASSYDVGPIVHEGLSELNSQLC